MDLWAVRVQDADFGRCAQWLARVSQERRDRIRRYRKTEDQLRAFFAEALVRVYAAEIWGMKHEEVIFQADAFHKPSLAHFPSCQFNLSHSGAWVVAAFHDAPVGIDIEHIAAIDLSLADRFFSAEEAQWLRQQPEGERIRCFYTLWTLKESYIKATGEGLATALDSFRFDLSDGGFRFESKRDARSWHFQRYAIDPAYALAACCASEAPSFPKEVVVISWRELLLRFEAAST